MFCRTREYPRAVYDIENCQVGSTIERPHALVTTVSPVPGICA